MDLEVNQVGGCCNSPSRTSRGTLRMEGSGWTQDKFGR